MNVAGFTSTGSKQPHVLFGADRGDAPLRMAASHGCTVIDTNGRSYTDFIMALGAVALGYRHEAVNRAAIDAINAGGIGPLAPEQEEQLAADIVHCMPHLEQLRFLKTGAEAAAAAVRLARTITGRDTVIGCGYHGWLDWCSDATGVPASTRALYHQIPFNDIERSLALIQQAAPQLACVIIEPVIDGPPDVAWLTAVRDACNAHGALLIFDEIKTAFRVAIGGAAQRWGVVPDLTVMGKALANGFPLAAVGGPRRLMAQVSNTWISSTLATEWVSMAAARATIGVMQQQAVPDHLGRVGQQLLTGLERLAQQHPALVTARGIPEMCHLAYADDATSKRAAVMAAERGLLFKRSGYNFVSLAHTPQIVESTLATLADVLDQLTRGSVGAS